MLNVEGLSFCTPVSYPALWAITGWTLQIRQASVLWDQLQLWSYWCWCKSVENPLISMEYSNFCQRMVLFCISNSILLWVMAQIILNHHQVGCLMTEPLSQTGCETVSDILIFAVCFQISCRATQYLFQTAIRKICLIMKLLLFLLQGSDNSCLF